MATSTVDVKDLLKAGAHFGHKPSHWHPGMLPYIHSLRGGIYIIDLLKTAAGLEEAMEFAQKIVSDGKQILFVGTKRHLRDTLKDVATSCKMPYVNLRWLGGTLTNFATISKRVKYLLETEAKFESGELAQMYNKREVGVIKEEMGKLNQSVGGIKEMTELPGAIIVADVLTDKIAVREANRLGIPVIAIVDTNGDPTTIEHVIPANDDAVSAVSLICEQLAAAINTAKVAQKSGQTKPAATKKTVANPKPAAKPKKPAAKKTTGSKK